MIEIEFDEEGYSRTGKKIKYIIKDDGCWECISHSISTSQRYPQIYRGIKTRIHRYIYEITKGQIPIDMVVMHKCDNVLCINPDHLKLGSQVENLKDMIEKGRDAKGSKLPQSKVTEDDVRKIRKDKRTLKEISNQYGISQSSVSMIKSKRTWRHVQ